MFAALLEITQFYTIPAYCSSHVDSREGSSLDHHYYHHKQVQSVFHSLQEVLGWQGQKEDPTYHLTTGLHLDLTQALNTHLQIHSWLLTDKYDCHHHHHQMVVDAGSQHYSSQQGLVLIACLGFLSIDNQMKKEQKYNDYLSFVFASSHLSLHVYYRIEDVVKTPCT